MHLLEAQINAITVCASLLHVHRRKQIVMRFYNNSHQHRKSTAETQQPSKTLRCMKAQQPSAARQRMMAQQTSNAYW